VKDKHRASLFKLLGVVTLAAGLWYTPYSLVWNPSASIPTGLYLSKQYDGKPLERQSIVCFVYAEPAWAAGRRYLPAGFRICKPIAGIEGDSVEKVDSSVRVKTPAGQTTAYVVPALTDRHGSMLDTQALLEGTVARGEVVLLAPAHPNSYDSRYLGAIQILNVTHQIWPLWVKD
jgi:type IV secretory pathway protease TraF